MTLINKLWDLREAVKFWNYKVETSYPQNASEMIHQLNLAKYKLKLHKQKHFPELLEQPKHNLKPIPFVPMDTWCEELEQTLIK